MIATISFLAARESRNEAHEKKKSQDMRNQNVECKEDCTFAEIFALLVIERQ